MNPSHQHLSIEKLTDLAEELTPREEAEQYQRHLTACSECESRFVKLQQLISAMLTDTSEDAPRDVVLYAKNLFSSHAKAAQPSLVRRLVAVLSFDSFTTAPAFGLRSGQTETRQLLYSAATTDIDLRVSSTAEGLIVSGQVLGAAPAHGRAQLASERISTASDLNDLHEFRFGPVPPGHYRLDLRLGELEVEVPEIVLGV